MTISTQDILNVLAYYDIQPTEDSPEDEDFPELGEIVEGEFVYLTSIDELFHQDDDKKESENFQDNPSLREWREKVDEIIEGGIGDFPIYERREPPEPHCAWYCPVHFFGHGWGIFIREACILSQAIEIAAFVDWSSVSVSRQKIYLHLLRSSFYVFFLHEQFHHKVESLGFRLLVSTGTDRYRPYKRNVYRPSYGASNCLEESLANAESFRRLGEPRYKIRLGPGIHDGLRNFLRASFKGQPAGYREGLNFLTLPAYRDGLYGLQSRILDGALPSRTPIRHWSVAPNMITSLADITKDIYIILHVGAQPIFKPASVDPGPTVSGGLMEGALTKHYGYKQVTGGKGSYIKLKKTDAPTITLPGNRSVLSPGVVKQVLRTFGDYPISRLPEFLDGTLPARDRIILPQRV